MKTDMRRGISIQFLAVTILLMIACGDHDQLSNESKKGTPNVLFIAIDDLNNMIEPFKGASIAKTPNFKRLAERGVLFTDAHCQAPLCGPSRASIMTGLRPSTTGIYGMIPDNKIGADNSITKDIILLPEYFKKNGYHTMGIGKLFHIHSPDSLFHESGGRVKGFGPYPEERFVWDGYGSSDRENYGRTSTDWGAFPSHDTLMPDHHSVDWASERLSREYKDPFFLGIGFLRVHVPLYVPQKWFDLYPLDSIITPPYQKDDLDDVPPVAHKINDLPMMPTTDWAIKSGEWKKIVQAYLACISFVDYELGRLIDALEKSKHADNTIIVLWSDHGYRLGEKSTFAKHALWNPATHVPLLFAGPGIPKGKIVDQPAELLSIYPTLLEACGLPSYEKNEGVSLLPLIQGNNEKEDHIAITTFGMNNHAVKSDKYRYIRYEDGGEEFYDYASDPNEFNNQARNPKYKSEIDYLKRFIPTVNSNWDPNSLYTFQPYFIEQKARTSASHATPN